MKKFWLGLGLVGAIAIPIACIPSSVRKELDQRAMQIRQAEDNYRAIAARTDIADSEKARIFAELNTAKVELATLKADAQIKAVDSGLEKAESLIGDVNPLVATFFPIAGRVLTGLGSVLAMIRGSGGVGAVSKKEVA